MAEDVVLGGFGTPHPNSPLVWDNEPGIWTVEEDGNALFVEVEGGTNYWQRTRHGRRDDNGHFLWLPMSDDFEMSVKVIPAPNTHYDQAGLMVRASEICWLKTSAEFELPGWSRLGAVVTNDGWSDWSTHDVRDDEYRLRIRRSGSDFFVDAAVGDDEWSQLRVTHLGDAAGTVNAGIYACAPLGSGFPVHFRSFTISK